MADPEAELSAAMAELTAQLDARSTTSARTTTTRTTTATAAASRGPAGRGTRAGGGKIGGGGEAEEESQATAVAVRRLSRSRRRGSATGSWEGGVNADDNDMLAAARQDPEEARDMAFGRNAWQNVPAIVRDKMLVLSQTVDTQATEIADLRSIVTALQESSRDTASHTWVETNVKKLSSTQDARIEGLARRVDQMRQTVDLKADAAYLTSCLLTKANKSEVNSMQAKVDRAAERVETNLRQQHDDRWERLQRASEAYREGVAMQLQEALRSMSTQRTKIDERIARVQASMRDRLDRPETTESGGSSSGSDNFGYDEPRPAYEANGKLIRGKSRRCPHSPVHGGKTGSNADPTVSREFNSLVRQVETLAAVQSKMQQVMQQLESRVDSSASKTDLQSIAAEKANKLSVANAIHRKANKDDLENIIAALTARLQAVEDGLSGGSARPSTGKTGRLRTDLDRALKALENVPSLEQVGTALDKLAEELKPQIDNALLGVDQLRRNAGKNHVGTGVNEGASGIANLSAIEGRVRAAHERCASLQSDLEERFGDLSARLRSVEDQIVAQDLVAKRMELSGVTHHNDNIDDEIEDVALEIVFSDSDEDNKEFVAEDVKQAFEARSMLDKQAAHVQLSELHELAPARRPSPRKGTRASRLGSGVAGTLKSKSKTGASSKPKIAKGTRKKVSSEKGSRATKKKHECAVGAAAREVVRDRLQRQVSGSRRGRPWTAPKVR